MKRLSFIVALYFLCSFSVFAYIYHCPSTIPDYNRSGDEEMWSEVTQSDPSVIGTYSFAGAEYNYITGEGSCMYQCKGCDSQGICVCNKQGSMLIKGTFVEPISNDNTKWKPSLNGNTATCSVFGNEACPWKLKVKSR